MARKSPAPSRAIRPPSLIGVAFILLLPLAFLVSPSRAATPGPECTVREVRVTVTRNFDQRYAGTLGKDIRQRTAATAAKQSVWKSRAAGHASPPATGG